MIARLNGRIIERHEKGVILDVAGVGYKLYLSAESLRNLPKGESPVRLFTHLAVRENALDLYGFVTREEHDLFELLISVSGIGPKSAIAILSLATPTILKKAVSAGDSAYLIRVSGIGRKSAEKIVLELKDKLGRLDGGESDNNLRDESEAIEALQALGYSLREAREALQGLSTDLDTGEKVKLALKRLGKNGV